MTDSHTQEWEKQRLVEDLLAHLHTVEAEGKLIIRRAYEFGDEQSFEAAKRQRRSLEKMRQLLEKKWQKLDKKNRKEL